MRRLAAALVVVLAAVTLVVTKAESTPWWITSEEAALVQYLNGQRTWYGGVPLVVDSDLTVAARQQAQRMAACGCLYHQDLSPFLRRGWRWAGENVGYGADWWAVHVALSYSPRHLANMNNPRFLAVGVGTYRSGNRLYVAQVFGGF